MTRAFAFAVMLGWLPNALSSELPPEILQLSKIKRKAAADLSKLKSFSCLATFDRAQRTAEGKPFKRLDVVRAEIAYIDGRELFAWPGSSRFDSESLGGLIGNGLAGSGDFIAHARTALLSDVGTIRYHGAEELDGRAALRYDYEVSPLFSGYSINLPEGSASIAVKGSVWADRESFDILRLTIAGGQIPETLGVASLITTIDYRRIRFPSGAEVLTPQTAATLLQFSSGKASRNDVQFTHCREYIASSAISFDAGEKDKSVATGSHAAEVAIPSGLTVTTRLTTGIDSTGMAVGDLVSGTIDRDLIHKRVTLFPAGAVITGRIRLLQKDGPDRFVVGVEFTDVTSAGKHARFTAMLQDIHHTGVVAILEQRRRTTTPHIAGIIESDRTETFIPPQLPGVATFYVMSSEVRLAPGLLMDWRTIALTKDR